MNRIHRAASEVQSYGAHGLAGLLALAYAVAVLLNGVA
jgi:hypothetical protein